MRSNGEYGFTVLHKQFAAAILHGHTVHATSLCRLVNSFTDQTRPAHDLQIVPQTGRASAPKRGGLSPFSECQAHSGVIRTVSTVQKFCKPHASDVNPNLFESKYRCRRIVYKLGLTLPRDLW